MIEMSIIIIKYNLYIVYMYSICIFFFCKWINIYYPNGLFPTFIRHQNEKLGNEILVLMNFINIFNRKRLSIKNKGLSAYAT